MNSPQAANERLLGCTLPLALFGSYSAYVFFFIINCQLLASLKRATSAGFLNIGTATPAPDPGPLEVTSVPTFSHFHPDNCGPIHLLLLPT